ncbi:11584_t:CDS:1, partial [Dentiscutata heterogama]
RKNIKKQLELEERQQIQEKISAKLQKRNINFTQNPKLFYKKVLERFGSNIYLDRLLLSKINLLTKPQEIKNKYKTIFKTIFKNNYYLHLLL